MFLGKNLSGIGVDTIDFPLKKEYNVLNYPIVELEVLRFVQR